MYYKASSGFIVKRCAKLRSFITGAIGGHIVNKGVRWGKLRDLLTAVFFGILFGLTTYVSYRLVDYAIIKYSAETAIMEEYGTDSATAQAFFQQFLYEETGFTGFIGLVLLDAKEGLNVTHRSSDATINVGTTFTWIYWLLEMGAFILIPALMAGSETKKPFCEYHDRWYDKEISLGGFLADKVDEMMGMLAEGNYNTFGKMMDKKAPMPGIEVCLERCPKCQESTAIFTVKAIKKKGRNKDEKIIMQDHISPGQADRLEEGIYAVGVFG